MVGSKYFRTTLLLSLAIATALVAIACQANPEPSDPPTTTNVSPSPLPATPTAAAPTPRISPDVEPTVAPRPTITPTPIPEPEAPDDYTLSQATAIELAERLGCSGWSSANVDGTTFYRACAEDEEWDRVNLTPEELLVLAAQAMAEATKTVPTPTAAALSGTPFNLAFTPTPASTPATPQYHYATEVEALAAAQELGCSGWTRATVEGISYFRACGDNRDFEILSSGAGVTLSGELCTIESDPTARFTHSPTDIDSISAIVPAGSPIGGVIKPHSYIFNKDAPGRRSSRVPVYAVADSVLTAVSYYGTSVGTSEYLIFFDVTCEISFKYDHISEVAPKIAAVAPQTPSESSATQRTDAITFKAGEIIGYTVGAGGEGPWDFGAYDLTYTNQFANQERYEKGYMTQSLHTVCPYEYFEEPLSSQLLALLGTHGQQILPGIPCYTTERDVLGAASGAWFDSLDLNFSDSVFSAALLAGDFVGVTGIGSDMRIAKGEPTWLDPAELTDSHCYSSNNQWIFIEIHDDDTTMSAAGGQGSCPSALPASATTYYR
jgi:hypothetical protein